MIGIVQGRLTQVAKNTLQKFPKYYEKEFSKAKSLNYDFIEFFSEKKFNKNNPIWSKKGISQYKYLTKRNNLKTYTFCDNYVINNSILKKKNLIRLKRLIKNLKDLNIKKLILPMEGENQVKFENIDSYVFVLKKICKYSYKFNIEILIESNISPNLFSILKKRINMKNFFLLYDTGNRAFLKENLYQDLLSFGKNVNHIHLKDKNKFNKNVMINTGVVNFLKIFRNLKKISYKKSFTIETPRGKDAMKTAKKNLLYFRNLIKKYK